MIAAGLIAVTLGSAFCLLAAIGMLRFPDFYTRIHAGAKAGVMGTGLILVGVALASENPWVAIRILVGVVFLVMTGPIAAHLLARAALKSGTKPTSTTNIDK